MPDGFFGGRGNLLTDVVFVCNLPAPVWAVFAASAARRGDHARHMRLQMTLWIVMLANLLLLEGYIRLSGGSGSRSLRASGPRRSQSRDCRAGLDGAQRVRDLLPHVLGIAT
jgi:hypothetical protein